MSCFARIPAEPHKGLFAQVGRLGFLGKGDPIEPIYQAVRGLNNYLDGVNENIAKLKSLSPALAGSIIGKGAADLTNAILDGIIGAVGSIDWGGVLVGVGSGIASFLANLDWKVYAVAAVGLIGAALIPPLLAAVGGFALALGAAIVSVVGAPVLLIGGAIVLGVVAITKLIGGNLDGIRSTIAGAGNAIKNGYNSVVAGIGGLLATGRSFLIGSLEFLFGKDGLKQITGGLTAAWEITKSGFGIVRDYVGAFISGSIKGVEDFFSGLGDAFGQIFNAVGEAIAGVVNAVKSLISSVVQPIQSSINGLSGSVSGYVSSVQNTGGLLAPQNALPAIGAAINPLGALTNFAVDKVASFVGARYSGQNLGLLDAIDAENASKPSGSSLVVANSSELIVPRDKVPQIRRGNTVVNVGGISLNITGATPIEIANQAISIISDKLQQKIEATLA